MKVEKKIVISFTEDEKVFLDKLYNTINTAICDQYEDKCDGCPYSCGASICANHRFFNGLNSTSDFV